MTDQIISLSFVFHDDAPRRIVDIHYLLFLLLPSPRNLRSITSMSTASRQCPNRKYLQTCQGGNYD